MTEAQAWCEIARRIAESTPWWGTGLCKEARYLLRDGQISFEVFVTMTHRILDHLQAQDQDNIAALCGYMDTPGNPGPRILAALLLAEECKDEAHAAP